MNNRYMQLGITGVAEDKPFDRTTPAPVKKVQRVELSKFIRNKCELSGREFARAVGVSPATITKWLYTSTMPSIRVVRRIATTYGVTVDYVDGLFNATG